MFSVRVEECPDPPMTRSERRGGGQEASRGRGGYVEDLPNRLYDMVVEFWQCAVEGCFLELLRHLSGVANLDVYWATTKFEAHSWS